MRITLPMPPLGLGTWGIGGKFERDFKDAEQSVELIKYALKIGYRLIDVAEIYGQGLTEEIVGRGIRGFPREQIYLTSKVWKDNLQYDEVLQAADGSLKRLQTDYLDLYLIHWPSSEVPLSETISAMEKLVELGKVRAIGVSNFSVSQMREAKRLLKKVELVVNQIEYNLFSRGGEAEIIPYCHAQGIEIMAYRPLAKGKIAFEEHKLLKEITKKYHKTPAQIALNWLIEKNVIPIPKAGSVAHLEENWGALGWGLQPEDEERLSQISFENSSYQCTTFR